MSALPYPKYSLNNLYLLPYYATREAYEKTTGTPCPPWDKTRRPQHWENPAALDSPDDFVIYDVLATDMKGSGKPLTDPNGNPYLRRLILPKEIAATVNIPLSGAEGSSQAEYPPPLRPLEPSEELFFDPVAWGAVMVKNKDLYVSPYDNTFTQDDRALLKAIALKLGV